MYTIIYDYIVITTSLIDKYTHKKECGRAFNSLIQVKSPNENSFGTIVPDVLYYKVSPGSKNFAKQKKTTITIYLKLKNAPGKNHKYICAVPLYKIFIIKFSEIDFHNQVDFIKEIFEENKKYKLIFTYLVSFVNKANLFSGGKAILWKAKRDAIVHLLYDANLNTVINDNYSIDLCMIVNNLSEEEKDMAVKSVLLSIVLKASEITFKEKLFSDIDTWDFFHRYSFSQFYRYINFLLYSKLKLVTYFIIIPIVSILIVLLIGLLIKKAPLQQIFRNSNELSLSKWLLQSLTLVLATVIILFYIVDAHITSAGRKEAKMIKNLFLNKNVENFAIPLNNVKFFKEKINFIRSKNKYRHSIRSYQRLQPLIKEYANILEKRIFGKSHTQKEIMRSLVERFLPNYITARDNALFNILWRQ